MDDQFERRSGLEPDSLEIELENLMDDQFERRPGGEAKRVVAFRILHHPRIKCLKAITI